MGGWWRAFHEFSALLLSDHDLLSTCFVLFGSCHSTSRFGRRRSRFKRQTMRKRLKSTWIFGLSRSEILLMPDAMTESEKLENLHAVNRDARAIESCCSMSKHHVLDAEEIFASKTFSSRRGIFPSISIIWCRSQVRLLVAFFPSFERHASLKANRFENT